MCGAKLHSDFVVLDQSEHVGQDGGVHGEAGRVRAVRDHREDVLQDVRVVRLVEALRGRLRLTHVVQQREQDVEARVRHVAHGVFERPDDRVQHQLELCGRDGQECCNTHTSTYDHWVKYSLVSYHLQH